MSIGSCAHRITWTNSTKPVCINCMKSMPRLWIALLSVSVFALVSVSIPAAEPPQEIALWPGQAPGDKGGLDEERDMTKPSEGLVAGKRVIRLGNVSTPTISLYRPSPGKDTGAAVLVCPGGAYNILALDLEGTEVCEWLNSLGVTGEIG